MEALCRPSGQEVSGAGRNPGTGGWNPKGAAQGASPLSRASGAAIKKVPGRCVTTAPAGTAHERPLNVTRLGSIVYAPSRLPPERGLRLSYSRDEARRVKQRIVSSAKTTRRLMRPTSLTLKRESAPCRAHGGSRATPQVYRSERGKTSATPFRAFTTRLRGAEKLFPILGPARTKNAA